MRVSRLFKQDAPASEPDGAPTNRVGIWLLLFAAVIVGLVLFFLYARAVPSVL